MEGRLEYDVEGWEAEVRSKGEEGLRGLEEGMGGLILGEGRGNGAKGMAGEGGEGKGVVDGKMEELRKLVEGSGGMRAVLIGDGILWYAS